MELANDTTGPEYEVIGSLKNFWLWSKQDGHDLTHPISPTAPQIYPRIPLQTTHGIATIDPDKTALVVIDFQNYFLSPLLGRPPYAVAMRAVDRLIRHAIPACREANIPVVWLGWGLQDSDLEDLPPAIVQGFAADSNFIGSQRIGPLGSNIGPLEDKEGSIIEGGRVMMQNQWNTEFYTPLAEQAIPTDIWCYKNRLSGLWGHTGLEEMLEVRGIRTLLFAGAKTDQCVALTLQDAFNKGWDCFMLSDGCATASPGFAGKCMEFDCAMGWGFVLSCEDFAAGVKHIRRESQTETNT